MIALLSTQSTKVSLEALRKQNGGLDAHRQAMLDRVPEIGNWATFDYDHIKMKDIAYLTAKTNHEFAILRGKKEDILFHGDNNCCRFDERLADMLKNGKLELFGHSHPGEEIPTPSPQDRDTLKLIKQSKSKLISGMTGIEIEFTSVLFEDILL